MFKGLGRSGGIGATVTGAVAAAVLALGVWIGGQRELSDEAGEGAIAVLPERDPTPENATLSQNAVQGASVGPEGTAATEPDAEAAESARAAEAPAFDEVRRDPDGMTVIAGRAAPGSTVAVLKDGEEIASATADGAGKFATLAMIPPDGAGHVLTLLAQDGDEQVASAEEILLAPIAAPTVTAEASAEEETAADQDVASDDAAAGAEADVASSAVTEAEDVAQVDDQAAETPVEEIVVAEADAAPEEVPSPTDPAATTPLVGTGEAEAGAEVAQSTEPAADTSSGSQGAADSTANIEASQSGDNGTIESDGATPLAGTATADNATGSDEADDMSAEADLAPTEDEATSVRSDVTSPASTATAEMEEETPTDPAQATPLAGTATADAAGDGEEAPSQEAASAETSASATEPSEENGVASSEPAPAATPLAGTGTEQNTSATIAEADTSDAPVVAETTPSKPTATAPTSDQQTAEPPALADASPTVTAPTPAEEAPAKPPAPAPAKAPVAVLKSTAEGVERIDTAPPQVMTIVALDTIGYSDQGDVQLSGRAQPDTSEVRVYLDNDAVISLPVDKEGRWRGDLPNVDEGVYTLRVDELSAGGDVTSRVETPFKRESPETLAAASAGVSGPLSAVTVQKGDTLWAISRERYGDPFLYVKVFEANSDNIRDPDLIYPGQVFDLPEEATSE